VRRNRNEGPKGDCPSSASLYAALPRLGNFEDLRHPFSTSSRRLDNLPMDPTDWLPRFGPVLVRAAAGAGARAPSGSPPSRCRWTGPRRVREVPLMPCSSCSHRRTGGGSHPESTVESADIVLLDPRLENDAPRARCGTPRRSASRRASCRRSAPRRGSAADVLLDERAVHAVGEPTDERGVWGKQIRSGR